MSIVLTCIYSAYEDVTAKSQFVQATCTHDLLSCNGTLSHHASNALKHGSYAIPRVPGPKLISCQIAVSSAPAQPSLRFLQPTNP